MKTSKGTKAAFAGVVLAAVALGVSACSGGDGSTAGNSSISTYTVTTPSGVVVECVTNGNQNTSGKSISCDWEGAKR